MDKYQRAAEIIKNAKKSMVLTGAGISTESGIPDFRSKGTGLWTKMDPAEALSAHVMYNSPEKFYSSGYKLLTDMEDVEANQGHKVLAEMERDGYISGIITQNIDNLHFKAGSKNIYEVHGQTRTITCTGCRTQFPFSVMKEKVEAGDIPPHCDKCQGILRTDVVLFGDQMPADFDGAVKELESTEVMIVVGSSLVVSPVSFLPRMVDKLIIINNDTTPYDRVADLVFHDGAGKTLQAIYDALKEMP